MISFLLKEDRTIWFCLIASLFIHGLLLALSGKTFIQQAQFSVQPSAQMVEVSIEDVKGSSTVSDSLESLRGDQLISAMPQRQSYINKKAMHAQSGVKVKANPDYFQNPSPEYPEFARQMRQEGLVMLSVDVSKEGNPVKIEIIQSSGYYLLDQAALKAISHWKFQPGNIGGIPIDSTVTVPIRFRLEK